MKDRDDGFVRIKSWPSFVVLMSKADARKVLAAIKESYEAKKPSPTSGLEG
jgi:hypothetical protein